MILNPRVRAFAVALTLLSTTVARRAAADTVVQVPVDGLIDGRTVATIANGTITPWTAMQGVDGDGNGDGYVTNAVEMALKTMGKTVGNAVGVALPDDGMFAATTRHPAVQLHFSNAAPVTSPQTHQIYINANRGSQMFMFNVPTATYSKMFLFITASEGAAALTITMNYAGGTAAQVVKVMLPDYGIGGATNPNDPVFFNLIAGMRKWGGTLNEGDSTTHTITGIELNPTAGAMMTSIQVQKTNGSHGVFWGATGIATSAVTTGTGGGGGTSDGGASDGAAGATDAGATGAAGSGGATGAAGAGGTAGVSGAAGATSTGAAGATGAAGTGGGTGAAGTTGAAGSTAPRQSSSGGCSLAGTPARGDAAGTALALGVMLALARRRRG